MRAATLRRVRTLVISDLHLGANTRADLLRRAELREPLLEAVRGVDRLVILGDALELRDGPQRASAASSRRRCSPTSGARSARAASCCCWPATTTTRWWRAGSTAG